MIKEDWQGYLGSTIAVAEHGIACHQHLCFRSHLGVSLLWARESMSVKGLMHVHELALQIWR